MFTLRDDPLARAVSLMGRVSRDRQQRDRYLRSQSTKRASIGTLEELDELRVSTTTQAMDLTREGVPGMEVLRGVYNLTQISQVTIDSLIFRLHSNATVILLVTFSIAVTTRQYVGNPIDCVHTRDIPEDVLNTYCWIHSTYTVLESSIKASGPVAYPGVSNYNPKGNKSIKQVKYYQWVAFMLFFQVSNLHIDSPIFRLHYSITVMMLIAFSLIVTTRQYVGNPIDCIHTKDLPEDVLNTFCWIHSTYTVRSAYKKKVGEQVPYPGVDTTKDEKDKKLYKYYQWVCFCLFFQAILFYTPRWLWKSWEGGKIHALMMDLDIGICSESEKRVKKKLMIDYLWENFRYHNWWAYKYYFCELLALINVIGQMFLMNRFFDGAFLTFGIEVIAFMESDQEDRVDPLVEVFPKMTKCTFYKYGVSGEVERHDAMCILPLNVVNEKIYVFLWFWFIILAILSFITIVYRIIIILSPRIRVYLLRMRFRLMKKDDIDLIVRRSKMGDWFLFYMLGENVDTMIFKDVIHELANKLRVHQLDFAKGYKGDIQEP